MIYLWWYIGISVALSLITVFLFISEDIFAKFGWFGKTKSNKFGWNYNNPLTYIVSAIMLPFLNILIVVHFIFLLIERKKGLDNEPK